MGVSNRSLWNVRKRHESLMKPTKSKRIKRRSRLRVGLEEALQRRADATEEAPASDAKSE